MDASKIVREALRTGIITQADLTEWLKEKAAGRITLPPDPEKVVTIELTGAPEGCLQRRYIHLGDGVIKDVDNWESSGYFSKNGVRGFPSEAFLKAMGNSLPFVELKGKKRLTNRELWRNVSVLPDDFAEDGLPLCLFTLASAEDASIESSRLQPPRCDFRTHILGGWKMTVRVAYDSTILCEEDVRLLMKVAGKNTGIGAWRKERGGVFGRWGVEGARAAS